jgi:hypothetical protein
VGLGVDVAFLFGDLEGGSLAAFLGLSIAL